MGKDIKFSQLTLRENWYKMFFRWYIMSEDIEKADKNQSIFQEQDIDGTFFHVLWTCNKATSYWKETKNTEYIKVQIPNGSQIHVIW